MIHRRKKKCIGFNVYHLVGVIFVGEKLLDISSILLKKSGISRLKDSNFFWKLQFNKKSKFFIRKCENLHRKSQISTFLFENNRIRPPLLRATRVFTEKYRKFTPGNWNHMTNSTYSHQSETNPIKSTKSINSPPNYNTILYKKMWILYTNTLRFCSAIHKHSHNWIHTIAILVINGVFFISFALDTSLFA